LEKKKAEKQAKTANGSPRSSLDKEALMMDRAKNLSEAKGKF